MLHKTLIGTDGNSQPPEPSTTDGSFPIRPPSIGVSAVQELIARGGYCAGITSASNKRDTDLRTQCFIETADLLFDQEVSGGPLDFILPLSKNMPRLSLSMPYLQPFLVYAKAHNPDGLSDDRLTDIANMNFLLVEYSTESKGQLPQNWDVPRSLISMSSSATVSMNSTTTVSATATAKERESTSSCPTPLPPCEHCNCPLGSTTCDGIPVKGQGNVWKGCKGTPREPPGYRPYDSLQALQWASEFLPSLFHPTVLPITISGKEQPGLGVYLLKFIRDVTAGKLS